MARRCHGMPKGRRRPRTRVLATNTASIRQYPPQAATRDASFEQSALTSRGWAWLLHCAVPGARSGHPRPPHTAPQVATQGNCTTLDQPAHTTYAQVRQSLPRSDPHSKHPAHHEDHPQNLETPARTPSSRAERLGDDSTPASCPPRSLPRRRPPLDVAAAADGGRARRPRRRATPVSAPRSPAAAAPPIPPSLILNSSQRMGVGGRNGDVSGPTTPKLRGDLHGYGGGPPGRATPSATRWRNL